MGIIAAGVVAYIIVLWIILKRSKSDKAPKIHSLPVSSDGIDDHVINMAVEHSVSHKKNIASWPLPRMDDNYNFILSVYTRLNEDILKNHEVPSSAEWILDNFYLIDEQVKQLRSELVKKNYSRLPVLKNGQFKGQSRIFALVMEMSILTDGQMDEAKLVHYLNTYQAHNKIFDREIWALPIAIKLALLENIRNVCEQIRDTKVLWNKADDIVNKLRSGKGADLDIILSQLRNSMKAEMASLPFIEHLLYRLKTMGSTYSDITKYLLEYLDKQERATGESLRNELNAQSSVTISVGNCITSLKYFSTFDWSDLFESVSLVGRILSTDPDGTYPRMDLPTRNYYRSKIEELASVYNIDETRIASMVIEMAKAVYMLRDESSGDEEAQRTWHVGYYLIGKGINSLQKELKARKMWIPATTRLTRNHPEALYIGSIALIATLLTGNAAQYAVYHAFSLQWVWALAAIVAVVIPSLEIAVRIVNWVADKTVQPAVFPALELKDGIPKSMSAIIVIPTLLPDLSRVKKLLNNLETHYLSNRDRNLYFAIVGAFKDSKIELPDDLRIIDAAMSGIKELNEKYAGEGTEIFYYFHRKSQYNLENKLWIGWKRKRGALMEFNELLLGSDTTSFSYQSNRGHDFSDIKYVITLDNDTILPIGMAKKMIGTMAHPLNRPVIDKKKNIVIDGYGLMQPRIDFDSENSSKSPVSKIYTGQIGIDPYSVAIFDIYQDMFGEGIYTGKGIYDLRTFQQILKDAIPEDKILSHDLYEGSYVRAALVTNLKLVESYPTKYSSLSAQHYRWTRGDWQLMPFLSNRISSGTGMIKNPLTLLSKWKIFDNLRRSLIAPSLMILIALGLSILPGNSLLWLAYAMVALLFPLLSSALNYVLSGSMFREKTKSYIPSIIGLKAMLLQAGLTFIFLPYQAYSMAKAAVLTLWRVYISKKNMLKWVTFANLEASQKETLANYYAKMHSSVWVAFILVILVIAFNVHLIITSLILFAVWSISPFIAYRISLDYRQTGNRLSEKDEKELGRIARKTWRYFEEFANAANNYLPPDNFQRDPYKGIAGRTSPTNIGLGLLSILTARDMGYIGNIEMADRISKTISTIENLKKWNGHLYNWYDTATLKPLNPGYISTVDSGNLVCYLITLAQGLIGCLAQPIADQKWVDGIMDTLGCTEQDGFEAVEVVQYLLESSATNPLDLAMWRRVLNKLSQEGSFSDLKDSPWRVKIERMIQMYRIELTDFAPWAELIFNMPQFLADQLSTENAVEFEKIITSLNDIPTLQSFPAVCKNALAFIESYTADCNCFHDETAAWLSQTRDALLHSIHTAEAFVCTVKTLIERIQILSDATLFLPLYDEKKQLFSIGYNTRGKKLTGSYYDLLASEARLTSFIAIARGEIPVSHWFRMGRELTVMDGYKGLISWSGTMFEYLMPLLVMKSYQNTLLDEAYAFAIRNQKKYGVQKGIPWGTSESCFYSLNKNFDYDYKAIGVPWLGLKRGLLEDAVTAPYATFLALMVDPEGAMKNIRRLEADGLEGDYGFYEAVDYTPKRLINGRYAIVGSFMAHHQGMSLVAIDNCLNGNIMQERFHADAAVRSARLLLQEKVPENVIFTKETKEKVVSVIEQEVAVNNLIRICHRPDPALPKAHILSNGEYSVMLTDRGTGYSKNRDLEITRWREDSTLDSYGMFFFFRNVETDAVWSSAYSPYHVLPKKYEVAFASDKVQFTRVDESIETVTEVMVVPGDAVEVRRVSLKNLSQKSVTLEITSYYEIVLATQAEDVAHPAFSNLFVRTEYLPEKSCLIATRRSKSNAENTWRAANAVVVEDDVKASIQFETDRMKFIGRGRSIASPAEIEYGTPLSNTAGPVLDPVMSLRLRIKIEPGKTIPVSFITAVSDSNKSLLGLVEKYSTTESVEAAFHLAKVLSQLESKYLNISDSAMEVYEGMISHILFVSPLKRFYRELMEKKTGVQSSLWAYGISGDLPIVLVVIDKTEEPALAHEVLKAHEYWWKLGLKVDVVILANMESSYDPPFSDLILQFEAGLANDKRKAFVLNSNEVPAEAAHLLYNEARIVLRDDGGSLAEQIRVKQERAPQRLRRFTLKGRKYVASTSAAEPPLRCFNGQGGFRDDGVEYEIRLAGGQNTPAPWVNVVANPGFGFMVSESGSSCTWCGNSRQNKLTPWSNDPVCDTPGEVLYLMDNDTGETWTVTALPIREAEPYKIIHGFGYSTFEHSSHGVQQSLVQFVPSQDPVKVSILTLSNVSNLKRELSLTYYVRPVLGVSDQDTVMHVRSRRGQSGELLIENPYNEEFSGYTGFLDSSIKERTVTGDRKEFFGSGGIASPDALQREGLSGALGAGLDPCAALQVIITLMPGESADVVFLLGMCQQESGVEALIRRYSSAPQAKDALEEAKTFWAGKLSAICVETPSEAFNLMMNGWLAYQTLSCRLWARSSFYQSGGAFGFRDQLQDCLSVIHICPEVVRSQILLHARHQFKEGDVQHWWHEPWGRGTRTRCSDDLLWLPYVTAEYIRITGDKEILSTQQPYLEDAVLAEAENERFDRPRVSSQMATLYEHCVLAIGKASVFGARGLPLMGTGDWNDGMNNVGAKGRGESVWLGWFMIAVLKSFAPVCTLMREPTRAQEYTDLSARLSRAIEGNAWDGKWYQRATFDDGKILGSNLSSECRIDSIAQSWAVLSGEGDPQRAAIAMDSVDKLLVDRGTGTIKLLTPPFDNGKTEPGYIKGYLPGVRENGGQYTHAAAWVIMAWAKLGEGDKAWEYFDLINPINHTRNIQECAKYKLEPYVIAGDVYAAEPHAGRGGWSWYTGSASWLYKTALEDMLGFRKSGNTLMIDPCISQKWTEYSIRYKYIGTIYVIRVRNPDGLSKGIARILVDGNGVDGNMINLVDDGATHDVDILLVRA